VHWMAWLRSSPKNCAKAIGLSQGPSRDLASKQNNRTTEQQNNRTTEQYLNNHRSDQR
jgi:hypothetical protein